MVYIPIDQETLLQAIRDAVEAAGGKRITYQQFIAASSLTKPDVFRHYPRWSAALKAAGINETYNERLDPSRLLEDWGAVVSKLQHAPSVSEYNIHGKYTTSTYSLRFGSWGKVQTAFRSFAAKNTKWKALLKHLPPPRRKTPPRTTKAGRKMPVWKPAARVPNRPAYGLPIVFDALLHAPVNELGVICLFSMMAKRLGFFIDGLQSAFPDCYAKRPLGNGAWQHVAIEFEFESRSFRHHGHPPDGCDIIVCWHHNWPDCPKNLQVIELSEEIKRFRPEDAAATGRGGCPQPPAP